MYIDDLLEVAPITERDNQHDKLILLASKNRPPACSPKKSSIKSNYKSGPAPSAPEIVYVLKPSGGTDTVNTSQYFGVFVGV